MARTTHETRFKLTAQDKTKRAFGSVRKGLAGLRGGVTGLHTGILALAGIGGIGFLTKGLVSVNAEFQTIKASLKTMTGGVKEAEAAFDIIEEFATSTPFDLQQVTQSFIKLKAMGLDPSMAALQSYGNTASAMGKSLDQMIEAVADAATGEFERLKEFGIRSKKAGEEVTFTFQGVSKTIKLEADAIQGYLMDIGNVTFAGAMSDQMNNLTPAFSNFSTAIDMLFVKVGEAGFNDVVSGLTNDMTDFITSLDSEQIAEFTRNAIENFAGFLDSIDEVTDSIAEAVVLWDRLWNGDTGLGGAGIPGGQANYRLGDFNDMQAAGVDSTTAYAQRDWRLEHGGTSPQTFQNDEETKGILREISERIRENAGVAVAG